MKHSPTRLRGFFTLFLSAILVAGTDDMAIAAQRPATSRQQAPRKNVAKSTTLTVTSNVPNATVTQDGIILGTAGSPFEVEPGKAVLDVSAPGYQTKKIQTVARPNVANTVNVVLVKLPPVKKPAPVARPAQNAPRQAQAQAAGPRGQPKAAGSSAPAKGAAPRKSQDLFGDDFAGASSGPPPAAQGGPITGPAGSPPRKSQPPRQPVARQNRQQQQQPQQGSVASPKYEPGYGPVTSMPAQPGYQQPYAQPYAQPYPQTPVYPQYPGYQPYPQYPAAPAAPSYGTYPGYGPGYPPGYAPGYPAPGYGVPQYQAPSPYYYYPQQPPAIVAPVAPADPVAPPSVAEAPLPSVAEAPSQSGPPPTDELVPQVSATKKASSGRNPVIKYLPFGAGQYQNGNYVLGGAFTAAQAGTLVLYIMNSSNAATAQTNYSKAIAARDDAINKGDKDSEAYYDDQANQQKGYGTTSGQNATLCLLGFGAAWVASTVEASINAPSSKGTKKSRGRRRGLAFETGIDERGLEAQISYNF